MDLKYSKLAPRVMGRVLYLSVILTMAFTRLYCLPVVSEPGESNAVYPITRVSELPTTRLYVDYLSTSEHEEKVHKVPNTTVDSPTPLEKFSTPSVKIGYVVPSVPVIILPNKTEVTKFVDEVPQPTGNNESIVNRTAELSSRRSKRTLPMFGIWPIFGMFRGLQSFGTMYPQFDYDIEKDGIKTSDIYPIKALKAVKEIVEKTDWDDLFMKMVTTVVNDFVNRILNKIFEKKHRSLDLWPPLRIPTLTRVQRLKRSATGQLLWHSSGAHRAAFPDRRRIDCDLRDICQAGRLLSRLPALQQLTMQLRSPGHESQWDAFLWGMRKKRCTRILCKRGRAPKGSRIPWHIDSSSS